MSTFTCRAAAVALVVLTAGVAPAAAGSAASQALAAQPAPGVAEPFATQELRWEACFPEPLPGLPPGSERLQCSVMTAPLDWNDPQRGSVDIAVSRLRPADDSPEHLLLTNPGGPGEEGVIVPLLFLDPAHAAVADTSEIVGMDVRGTGGSTNITCAGTAIGRERDVRDRSAANVSAMLDDAEALARACQEASAPIGDYINTAQTVRDLDLLRSLLGHERTNWFSYSAGSWIGAQYATVFPERVGRFVFDSSVQFTGTWQEIYALQPLGFERRFRQDFLPWTAQYPELYGLGASAEEVRGSYERVRAELARSPLDIGGEVLHATELDSLIASSLYSKTSFPALAELLAGLNAFLSGAPQSADAAVLGQMDDLAASAEAADAIDATFYSIGCNDTRWLGNRQTLTVTSEVQGRAFPLVGWRSIAEPCLFWDRPAVDLPRPTGRGVPPVLIVQSAHDPATPLEGAEVAAARFAGARLLTVTDEGDHLLFGYGNACVDAAVDAYLADGDLPAPGATCAGGPLPDPYAAPPQPPAGLLSDMSVALPS